MSLARILAPIDFSEESRIALAASARLARRHGALLTLLHVDKVPAFGERLVARSPADVGEQYLRERADAAKRLLEEMASGIEGVQVQVAVARDDVPRAIVDRASREGDELIVVGAHGSGSGAHSWIGTIAFEVAARATSPVLVTRGDRTDAGTYKRPLLAVGLDRPIDSMVALANTLCGESVPLDFLHVHETPSSIGKPSIPPAMLEAREHAHTRRAERLESDVGRLHLGRATLNFAEAESASDAIFSRIAREGHDLVIVGQRGDSSRSGTLGSIARRLLEHARISVAVLPPTD